MFFMIETLNIINEISDYKTLEIKHLERYNFKKSDNAYLVKTGALLSFGENNFTQLLGEYDPIGFSEIILAQSKKLKYKILSDLELYSFSGSKIRDEVNNSHIVVKSIIKYSLARIFDNRKSNRHYLLEDQFIAKYHNIFRKLNYVRGDKIFICNQEPRGAYYIEKGSVAIITNNKKHLADLNTGETFGESALISGKLRNNTAIANCNTSLIEINSKTLKEQIDLETPLVKLSLLSVLKRLELTNKLRKTDDFRF